ncbi:TauD-domain-containing protein [Lindgomyces ingoldianus]|uniref:TauD-domain-containing protein n=1 Tax=Lindgomyces ingoldianus TaxID=673940 RepID=A0ACB6R0A1_9PLEO|nr:TauD-domain-containing protein [Lindgomyces ingoldianus]KAF2472719.1 TauD-domain-containing protein [Lindgomyces ingoldianus]
MQVAVSSNEYPKPLKSSAVLDKYDQIDVTPSIGTEFHTAKIVKWINASNVDEFLLDLAIKSRPHDLTNDLQRLLMQRLGELTGKPKTSRLHIHPVMNSEGESSGDPEINTISSAQRNNPKRQNTAHWNSDTAFEPVPADYTSLRGLPRSPRPEAEHTVWASGYEINGRLSEPYQRFLETLTSPNVRERAWRPRECRWRTKGYHRVVRANPVTGWKSIYPVGRHVQHINGLTEVESKHMMNSVFHTAILDCDDQGNRFGIRAIGIGEKPYFDPILPAPRRGLLLDSSPWPKKKIH